MELLRERVRMSVSAYVSLIENVSGVLYSQLEKKNKTQTVNFLIQQKGRQLYFQYFIFYCVFSPFVSGLGAIVEHGKVGLTTQHQEGPLTETKHGL